MTSYNHIVYTQSDFGNTLAANTVLENAKQNAALV